MIVTRKIIISVDIALIKTESLVSALTKANEAPKKPHMITCYSHLKTDRATNLHKTQPLL